jgi:hypothetical protein
MKFENVSKICGEKAAGAWGWQPHHLHVTNVMEIWEPKPPGNIWATPGLLGTPLQGEPAFYILHTGCPRRDVPDLWRMFLMLKYTDITQNTYVQSWTVTEIMAREKCGLLAVPRTVPVSWQSYHCPSLSVVSCYGNSAHTSHKLHMYFLQSDNVVHVVTSLLGIHVSCMVFGTLKTLWHECECFCSSI